VASKVHGRQAEAEHDCTSWERLLGAATEDASRTRQNPTTTMKLRFHRAIYSLEMSGSFESLGGGKKISNKEGGIILRGWRIGQTREEHRAETVVSSRGSE